MSHATSRTFYYGSGSPYAWSVWLALEHKQLEYTFKQLSFDKGDTRSPEFLALNPRGKVPVLVDDGLVLWESSAIAEYLEERYPERPLLPQSPAARAQVRRLVVEVNTYFVESMRALRPFVFGREQATPEALASARDGFVAELARFEAYLGDHKFLAGEALSLADFSLYPHLRLLLRFDQRIAGLGAAALIPGNLQQWAARLAELPYHDRTLPPHWAT